MNMDAHAMDTPFSTEELRRRRAAARRLALALAAATLALYVAGFWLGRG